MTVTGRTLKWVGIISMTLDHIGAVLLAGWLPASEGSALFRSRAAQGAALYLILRLAGRLAFPIFCFLLTEGFCHTRSRKRYAGRLLLFSVLSEIPFDLAFHGKPLEFGGQNVFVTLFLGTVVMFLLEKAETASWRPGSGGMDLAGAAAAAGIVGLGCAAAEWIRCDYGGFGILLISVLYLLRSSRRNQTVSGAVLCLPQVTAPLAFLLIGRYRGEEGKRGWKYFFYIYYPLHLSVLVLCAKLFF